MSFTKKMPSFGSNKPNDKTNSIEYAVKDKHIDTHKDVDETSVKEQSEAQNDDSNISNADNNECLTQTSNINKLHDEITTLKQNIQDLVNKNKTLETKLVYIASEYENTKKRNTKELEDAHKFSIAKFASDAVKIFDILTTAIDNTEETKNDKSFYDGVKMTIADFNSLFKKLNIEKIDPKEGEIFDHNLHEAISRVPSELDVGAIVKVIRCGYALYGRLLRPAMVVVSAGK